MKLWYKHEDQIPNLRLFQRRVVQANPDIEFFRPDPDAAPWHVQALVNGRTVNFWPHVMKANIEREPAVVGIEAVIDLVDSCRLDEDFQLIDDEDADFLTGYIVP